MKTPRYSLLTPTALFLSLPLIGFAQTTWDFGGTPDKNWSTFTNWSTDANPAGTAVVFGATGVTANATTVGNIVDTSYTTTDSLTSLTYNANSTNWQVTQINSPQTLTVAGTAPTTFTVGGLSGANTTKTAFTGTGSLVINNSGSAMSVSNGGSNSAVAILDMSALTSFTATVSAFNIGNTTQGYGTVYLADTSTVTATTLNSGGSSSSYGSTVSNKLFLGTTTTLNVDTLKFGQGQTFGTFKFRASGDGAANNTTVSGALLKIRGSDGTSAATTMNVGAYTGGVGGAGTTSLNLTGGSVDAKVTTLKVGVSSSTLANSVTGSMSMAAGTFEATTVVVGETTGDGGSSATGVLTGTLNVSGGIFTAGTMTLANGAGTVNATGTRTTLGNLNVSGTATVNVAGNLVMGNRTEDTVTPKVDVSGGTLTVGGNLAEGTGTASSIASTVNLSGGTLDMTHGTVTVDTFGFTGGTLKNVATFTGSLSVQNTATLGFDLDGTSPTLTLTGLTLGGSSNLSLSLLNDITPSAGYTLVSGTISGTFLTVNGAAFDVGNTFTLSNNLGTYIGTLTYNASDITLALSAIPEPSTYAALAGVIALGMVAWRRKRVVSA